MAPSGPVVYRPGRNGDLDSCTRIWRAALEDYQARLNQPPVPDDLGPLRRLLAHLLSTDPDRFWVAVRTDAVADPAEAPGDDDPAAEPIVGFSSASRRGDTWFLAMLFVDPAAQRSGIGQALMDRAQAGRDVDPGGPAVPGPDDALGSGIRVWGMCTDAVQPISNALYARRGMIPRVPIWRLLGEVRRWQALPPLPRSLDSASFESVAGDTADGLDCELLGSAHPQDHAWLRREGRVGFLVRDRGDGRPLGYAYGSSVGRLGPVAALDAALHPALLGTAIRGAPAFGAVAIWVPGSAELATRSLLDAGLRFDGFPGLVCWSAADHPFARYVPISLALV